MAVFEGSGVAVITPFRNGKIDFESFAALIEWQIAEGTDAIVAAGTTGEASTLSDDEQIEVIRFAVETAAGRIPVVAGVGSNETSHGLRLTERAEKAGADALLHVTPYYNKASRRGMIEHFRVMAQATSLPILLYSVAGRTGMNIAPDVCEELAGIDNIVGIKEASGDISQVVEIARRAPEGFDLYSGNDDMIVPLLSVGGKGVISVLANIAPRDTHDMVERYLAGDVRAAAAIQLRAKPLIDALFCEVNPIPVKAALYMMGKCAYEYRLPLCQMESANFEKLKKEMRTYGLLP
ncbi:MAG: 4-hydroxy-tetrahydrodipicolinate synthase [Clostridiales Family XIII bacterium]|jgi:4-hydroxy-tetrahydrodipicolinate synthase|nr:4-hydroxy-tetrahydrodipicolinate synthase [Clostridiales Family XIII bacterium]